MLNSHARTVTVEAPVEDGNTVVIDFKGLLDGEAFEGGSAEKFDLVVGSGSFIPGFEEQIIGHKAGEEFEVNVTFPEDYPAEELAGKPAVFEVKLHEVKVKELPELNDEFAQDTTEFESRSEEHTSELQSRQYLVCRLLLEKTTQYSPSSPRSRSRCTWPRWRCCAPCSCWLSSTSLSPSRLSRPPSSSSWARSSCSPGP